MRFLPDWEFGRLRIVKYSRGILLKFLLPLAVLLVAGAALRPLEKMAIPAGAPKYDVSSGLGQGVLFGILGGYRSIIADFIWLKAYVFWEREDLLNTISNIELATRLDPGVIAFWNLGGGIIAYDTPHWIIESRPHTELMQRHVREKQAKLALEFLDRGLQAVPDSRRLKLDKAIIYMRVFDDIGSALKCYEAASEGEAPLFIMRDYARLLERAGKLHEALGVLRRAGEYENPNHPAWQFLQEHISDLENKLRNVQN